MYLGTVPMQVATQNVKMTFCPNSLTQPSSVAIKFAHNCENIRLAKMSKDYSSVLLPTIF